MSERLELLNQMRKAKEDMLVLCGVKSYLVEHIQLAADGTVISIFLQGYPQAQVVEQPAAQPAAAEHPKEIPWKDEQPAPKPALGPGSLQPPSADAAGAAELPAAAPPLTPKHYDDHPEDAARADDAVGGGDTKGQGVVSEQPAGDGAPGSGIVSKQTEQEKSQTDTGSGIS